MAALGRASGKLELDASQLLFRAPAWPSTMHMPVNRRSLIGQHAAWGAAEFRLFAEGAAIAGLLDPPTCALPPNAPDPTAQRLNPDWGSKCTFSMGPLAATGSWWPTGVCHDPGRSPPLTQPPAAAAAASPLPFPSSPYSLPFLAPWGCVEDGTKGTRVQRLGLTNTAYFEVTVCGRDGQEASHPECAPPRAR